MNRLPLMTYDVADDRQRALWDQIIESRGKGGLSLVTAEGGLAGPFAAFVRTPHLGEPLLQVGAAVRFGSSLDPRLLELAITTVGARWQSEFEFWAHSGMALAAGLDQSIIDALAAGEEPVFTDPNEQVIHRFTVALANDGRVDQATYDAAVDAVGVDQVVELTHTIGYYSYICFVLNTFEVPLPPGVAAVWSKLRT